MPEANYIIVSFRNKEDISSARSFFGRRFEPRNDNTFSTNTRTRNDF